MLRTVRVGYEPHAGSPPGGGATWTQGGWGDPLNGDGDQVNGDDLADGVGGEEEDVGGGGEEVEVVVAVKVDGFEELGDGDPEPAIGAPIGEGVEHGVAKPALLVDEEPRGGAGEGVALANEAVVGDDAGERLVDQFQANDFW